RVIVAAQGGRQLEGDQIIEGDARVGGLEILQAPDEQTGTEEQQKAERHLGGDQSLPQEQGSAGAGNGSHGVLQRGPQFRPACPERGDEAEDNRRDARETQRKEKNASVRLGPNQNRLALLRYQRQKTARQHHG